jgi:ABC-type uncharacterized transport system permease subunit
MKIERNTLHWIGGAVILFFVMLWTAGMEVRGSGPAWAFGIRLAIAATLCFLVGWIWEAIQWYSKKGNANFDDVLRVVGGGLLIGLPVYVSYVIVFCML